MKRIITENGPDGRSRIRVHEELRPQQMVWETSPENWLGDEPVEPEHTLAFAEGHVVVRYIEIPPEAVMAEYLKAGIPGHDQLGFHRTGTIDYLILLEGRLILEVDQGRAELGPGDIVVQRDTRHAWRNPEPTKARCMCIISRPQGGS